VQYFCTILYKTYLHSMGIAICNTVQSWWVQKKELQSVNRPLHSFKPYISPHEGQWTVVTIVQTPPTCLASQKVYEAPRSHAHKIVSSHFRATPRPSRLAECDPGPCAQHASHMYLYTFRLFRRGFFFLPCHFSHFEEGRMESSGDG